MNDGFCDICLIFKGHGDLKSTFGILFCAECRDKFLSVKKADLTECYQNLLGFNHDQPTEGASE